ncbi:peptidoglycan bridge formation glycyltransferase FemA/FemB family protein [uncultured Methanolobus sp.]|uniref:lipid II:glycine glycyltransferase FemX n=1 Tax=uncultured Methanolobus sp. TaxID=218300 RepID=UPI002AAC22FC|nr:peptidoglycan bridge formation glycyltransferase FemA/FemB family protein [uncultured Methanolobus sp.]
MVIITDDFDNIEWDQFVLDHPHGNIFQTSYMSKVYEKTNKYEPVRLVAKDEGSGELLALVQGSVISEMLGIFSSFSSRSVLQGAPLFVDSVSGMEAVRALMVHYNKLVGKKIVYTQIRNMWDTGDCSEILTNLGYKYDEHLDFLIDLNRPEEEIWSDIQKSRRKGINRAERNGIVVRSVENKEELDLCYNLVLETYKRFKIPIADISLFEAVYDDLSITDHADFFIAFKNEEVVGTRITLNYKDVVYDWYAGSRQGVDYVDEALVWYILKINAGKYKVFDFGGAGHPDKPYGVREFKRRFGGEMVNYGRYERVHSSLKESISQIAFKAYKQFL